MNLLHYVYIFFIQFNLATFSLKCPCLARNVRGHVFVCQGCLNNCGQMVYNFWLYLIHNPERRATSRPWLCVILDKHLHDGCHQWSRNYLPFRSTRVYSRFLVGYVFLYLQFYVYCRWFFVLSSFFFDLRIMITPLVFSNSS